MTEIIKKIWNWFNGKKSAIGVIGLSVCQLGLISKNVDPDILEAFKLGFSIIGGVGIIHKDLKSDNSIVKRVNQSINKSVQKYRK